jgi:hypothetical protein
VGVVYAFVLIPTLPMLAVAFTRWKHFRWVLVYQALLAGTYAVIAAWWLWTGLGWYVYLPMAAAVTFLILCLRGMRSLAARHRDDRKSPERFS